MGVSRRSLPLFAFLAIAAVGAVAALQSSLLSRGGAAPASRPTETASRTSSPSAPPSNLAVSIPSELSGAVWFDTSGSPPIARRLRGAGTPLPLGMTPLDASGGRALLTNANPTTSSVSVVDLASGNVLAQFAVSFQVAHGQLRGERIYVDGTIGGKDVGVWTATLADHVLSEFIAPPATPPEGVVARGPLRASPTGMTVGSSLCGMNECMLTQLRAIGAQPETIRDAGGLLELTDSMSLLIAGQELRAFTAGKLAWQLTSKGDFFGTYALSNGNSIVVTETSSLDPEALYSIELVDVASGATHTLASWQDEEPQLRLIPSLSSDRYALLLSAYTLEQAATDPSAFVEIIDLERGSLLPGSVPLISEADR